MTPEDLAKADSESAHQQAFFAYCAFATNNGFAKTDLWAAKQPFSHLVSLPIPALKWIHSSGNGNMLGDTAGKRAMRAARMKAEGMKPGVVDIFWPYPVPPEERSPVYCGLYIEMKRPSIKPKRAGSKGGVSEDQTEFMEYVTKQGYAARVCYSWLEAVTVLRDYYMGDLF